MIRSNIYYYLLKNHNLIRINKINYTCKNPLKLEDLKKIKMFKPNKEFSKFFSTKQFIKISNESDCISVKNYFTSKFKITFNKLSKLIRLNMIEIKNKNEEKVKINLSTKLEIGHNIILKNLNLEEHNVNEIQNSKTDENLDYTLFYDDVINNNILFKNEFFYLINKPSGLPSQGGKNIKFSLDKMISNEKLKLVHRLDRNVSGLMILSKNKEFNSDISDIMKNNKTLIKKTYIVIAQNLNLCLLKLVELNKINLIPSLFDRQIYIQSDQQGSNYILNNDIFFYSSNDDSFILKNNENIEYIEKKTKSIMNNLNNVSIMSGNFLIKEVYIKNFGLFKLGNLDKLMIYLNEKVNNNQLQNKTKIKYETLFDSKDNYTIYEYTLITGKKHQIRIHSGICLKTPIINDFLYFYNENLSTLMNGLKDQLNFEKNKLLANYNNNSLRYLNKYGIFDFKNSLFLNSSKIEFCRNTKLDKYLNFNKDKYISNEYVLISEEFNKDCLEINNFNRNDDYKNEIKKDLINKSNINGINGINTNFENSYINTGNKSITFNLVKLPYYFEVFIKCLSKSNSNSGKN